MQKREYPFLDFIKAAAIVLVVLCHYADIPEGSMMGNQLMVLTSAAVPCFFMCSGYVMLFKEPDLKKTWKRIVSTYVRIVVWKALYLVFFSCFYEVSYSKSDLVCYLFLFGSLPSVMSGHLWFMDAYLLCLLMMPVLAPLFREGKNGTILWLMAVVYASNQMFVSGNFLLQRLSFFFSRNGLVIDNLAAVFPFTGGNSWCLFFLMLGGYLRVCDEKKNGGWLHHPLSALALFMAGQLGLMWIKYVLIESWVWTGAYLPMAYQWSSTIALSLGMFLLLQKMGDTRTAWFLGKYIGKNTMGIFYLHIPMLEIISQIRMNLIELPYELWVHVGKTIAVTVFGALLTCLLKKLPVLKALVQ